MPCLSLRHHTIFGRLCRWVDSARQTAPSSDEKSVLAPAENLVLEPMTVTAQDSVAQDSVAQDSAHDLSLEETVARNLETQNVTNQDPAVQTSDGTLHIVHSRTPLFAPSLLSDHGLADLVDAKLKALAAPEATTESIAEQAVQPASDPTVTNPVKAENDENTVNIEDAKNIENTANITNAANSVNAANVASIATPKPAFRLPFACFFSRSARHTAPRRLSQSELLNAESHLGSTIFGPIPAGRRREFFHDKQNIWIWHESWLADDATERQITVRYEVRPTGIYKKFAAGKYIKLENAELDNFRRAAHAYLKVVKAGLYTPTTEVLQ